MAPSRAAKSFGSARIPAAAGLRETGPQGPGNGAPLGGLKVVTRRGWFAARPSGTEDVYKIYAESFDGPDHLRHIQEEAQTLVGKALGAA